MRKTCKQDVTPKPWHPSQSWRSSFRIRTWEGLLLRLHQGHESREIVAGDSITELRRVWPEYRKSLLTADQLNRRFTVSDLRRAARYDEGLRRLLEILGL